MNDYTKMSEDELFSELDAVATEIEARLELDKKEAEEAEEAKKLLDKIFGYKDPELDELDKRKLYWTEHDVRLDGVCISTWWSPEDERKVLDVVDTCSNKENSIFCDGISYGEFCEELEDLLK